MKLIAATLLTTLIAFCGCQSEKSPFPPSYSSTTLKQISALRTGDTPEEVIRKLGSPASVAVVLPWLMYYAQDKEGYYYRVSFTLTEPGILNPKDTIERVTVTSGIFDAPNSFVVWPESKKKRANQPPQRNAGSHPLSADSPASETSSSLGPRG
jgi:hypothetical protein